MEAHIGYIQNGVNLDHIPQGNAWYVIRILGLENCNKQVGIGLNLPSKKLGRKDLIKIENWQMTIEQIAAISLFCVGASLSIIENYNVISKCILELPNEINDIIICPNNRCVSQQHTSKFITEENHTSKVYAKCHYCEQSFPLNEIKNYKI